MHFASSSSFSGRRTRNMASISDNEDETGGAEDDDSGKDLMILDADVASMSMTMRHDDETSHFMPMGNSDDDDDDIIAEKQEEYQLDFGWDYMNAADKGHHNHLENDAIDAAVDVAGRDSSADISSDDKCDVATGMSNNVATGMNHNEYTSMDILSLPGTGTNTPTTNNVSSSAATSTNGENNSIASFANAFVDHDTEALWNIPVTADVSTTTTTNTATSTVDSAITTTSTTTTGTQSHESCINLKTNTIAVGANMESSEGGTAETSTQWEDPLLPSSSHADSSADNFHHANTGTDPWSNTDNQNEEDEIWSHLNLQQHDASTQHNEDISSPKESVNAQRGGKVLNQKSVSNDTNTKEDNESTVDWNAEFLMEDENSHSATAAPHTIDAPRSPIATGNLLEPQDDDDMWMLDESNQVDIMDELPIDEPQHSSVKSTTTSSTISVSTTTQGSHVTHSSTPPPPPLNGAPPRPPPHRFATVPKSAIRIGRNAPAHILLNRTAITAPGKGSSKTSGVQGSRPGAPPGKFPSVSPQGTPLIFLGPLMHPSRKTGKLPNPPKSQLAPPSRTSTTTQTQVRPRPQTVNTLTQTLTARPPSAQHGATRGVAVGTKRKRSFSHQVTPSHLAIFQHHLPIKRSKTLGTQTFRNRTVSAAQKTQSTQTLRPKFKLDSTEKKKRKDDTNPPVEVQSSVPLSFLFSHSKPFASIEDALINQTRSLSMSSSSSRSNSYTFSSVEDFMNIDETGDEIVEAKRMLPIHSVSVSNSISVRSTISFLQYFTFPIHQEEDEHTSTDAAAETNGATTSSTITAPREKYLILARNKSYRVTIGFNEVNDIWFNQVHMFPSQWYKDLPIPSTTDPATKLQDLLGQRVYLHLGVRILDSRTRKDVTAQNAIQDPSLLISLCETKPLDILKVSENKLSLCFHFKYCGSVIRTSCVNATQDSKVLLVQIVFSLIARKRPTAVNHGAAPRRTPTPQEFTTLSSVCIISKPLSKHVPIAGKTSSLNFDIANQTLFKIGQAFPPALHAEQQQSVSPQHKTEPIIPPPIPFVNIALFSHVDLSNTGITDYELKFGVSMPHANTLRSLTLNGCNNLVGMISIAPSRVAINKRRMFDWHAVDESNNCSFPSGLHTLRLKRCRNISHEAIKLMKQHLKKVDWKSLRKDLADIMDKMET